MSVSLNVAVAAMIPAASLLAMRHAWVAGLQLRSPTNLCPLLSHPRLPPDPNAHVVKLCDFGSAKMLVKGETNIAYICSRYYRAPELIFGATDYTTAIDTWSFGWAPTPRARCVAGGCGRVPGKLCAWHAGRVG